MDQVEPQELEGTDGAERPFWSPQSDVVGYFVITAAALTQGGGATLKKVSIEGGPSTTLCRLNGFPRGATWRPDGAIVLGLATIGAGTPGELSELVEVSAQGGDPHSLLKPDSTKGERGLRYPSFLPDGKTLVFVVARRDSSSELVVQAGETRTSLLSFPGEQVGYPTYAPSGHLVYQRGWPTSNGIWVVPFSGSTVTGKPFLVAQTGALPSVSAEGTLVYGATAGSQQLVWVSRSGKVEGPIGQPQESLLGPALSSDGRRVAVMGRENGNSDIWIHDVTRGTKTRLTSDPASDLLPVWSPRGDQLAFESQRSGLGDVYLQAADGTSAASPLVNGSRRELAPDWSRGEHYVIFTGSELTPDVVH